ncbi:hypothetical protein HP439_12060 [Sphingobacterium shayense]|uniref:hypothetical protein n=1 Tax=Sphingobacterium shayense TaxID=626343 RepID=UPI001552B9CA|nr:hypothetical protein [Sphingobacterium shayense]NQD71458.1 hypothetical protein [Sphingobacterium shayense]
MSNEISKTVYNKVGDAIDVVIKPLNERMSNPLIGSFVISWTILNWKPILFLIFSSQSIENKIKLITSEFYPNQFLYLEYSWYMYLIFPLILSIIYTLGTPRLENFISKINRPPTIRKNTQLHTDKIADFKKLKEIASEEAAVAEAKSEYKTLLQKDQVINDLNKTVEILKNQEAEQIGTINDLLEASKRIKAENITLNKTSFEKDSYNEHQLMTLTSIVNRVITEIPTKNLGSLINEIKHFVAKYGDNERRFGNELVNNIRESISRAESINPPFVLQLQIDDQHQDNLEYYKDIVKSLFEVISDLSFTEENKMEIVCRFKIPTDNPEMYDFILDSIPGISAVRFSKPEFLRNGKVKYKQGALK